MEDIAGEMHEYLAYALMLLVVLHAGAAMLHHFVYKDVTLKRMLGLTMKEKK
jgi:cytochrome b561